MVGNTRVTTISFGGSGVSGTVEEVKEGNRRAMLGQLEKAALDKPDIVCLPEAFASLGLDWEKTFYESGETVPGPTTTVMADVAKKYQMYIVCPVLEKLKGRLYNSAVLIDRDGGIVGKYHKMYPTIGEIEGGITPGTDPVVLKTDFGPVGFAICFDLNFRDVGEGLKAKGAKLVFFPSMYEGGLQLSIWAHDLSFYMVSANTGIGSAIIDPLGRTLVRSDIYRSIISEEINLDFEVLHFNSDILAKSKKRDEIKRKYGADVKIDIAAPEGIYVLYSKKGDVTAKQIVKEFEHETRDELFRRAKAVRQKALG